MLQFDKSLATNTNAVYLDTVNTGSGYYGNLVMVYSQSYDNSNGVFVLDTISAPTAYNSWLLVQNSGSSVPSPSGQYDVGIYTREFVGAVWGTEPSAWGTFEEIWSTAGDDLPVTLLYSDRAFVSGSNESDITQYVSPDENGTYITYNG